MTRNLRADILHSASRLFYARGIKATGIDAIVRAAGTTKMSLYKYFPSKDDLTIAVLRQRNEEFSNWFNTELNRRAEGPKDRLLAIFDLIGERLASPDFRGCPFINTSAEFPSTEDPAHRYCAEYYDRFLDLVTELAVQSGLAYPRDLARQLVLLIQGAVVSEQLKRGSGAAQAAKCAAIALIGTCGEG